MGADVMDELTLLDAREVRRILKCSLSLVYLMAERGQIPCVRWQGPGNGKQKKQTTVRFKLDDVRAFISSHYNR